MMIFWAAIAILTLCAEVLSVALVCIWFTLGAGAALLAAYCGAPVWLQWVLFIAVSAIGIVVFRRLWARQRAEREATNLDRYIGETVLVTEEIDGLRGTGEVKISGQLWAARTRDKSSVPLGAKVTVLGFAGSKAIVAYEQPDTTFRKEEK